MVTAITSRSTTRSSSPVHGVYVSGVRYRRLYYNDLATKSFIPLTLGLLACLLSYYILKEASGCVLRVVGVLEAT